MIVLSGWLGNELQSPLERKKEKGRKGGREGKREDIGSQKIILSQRRRDGEETTHWVNRQSERRVTFNSCLQRAVQDSLQGAMQGLT